MNKIVVIVALVCCAMAGESAKSSGSFDSWLTGVVKRVVPNTLTNMYNRSVQAVEGVVQEINSFEDRFKSFSNFYSFVARNWKPIQRQLKNSFDQLIKTINLSEKCLKGVERMVEAAERRELWPWQFIDASGKLPTSMSMGTMTSFGDYDMCLKIKSDVNPKRANETLLRGKYCLVKPYMSITNFKKLEKFKGFKYLTSDTNKKIKKELLANVNKLKMLIAMNIVTEKFYLFHYGLCMPDVCDQKDIDKIYTTVIKPLTNIPVDVGPHCDISTDEIEWNLFNRSVVMLALAFIGLSAIGTATTMILNKCLVVKGSDNRLYRVVRSFSVVDNHRRLFSQYKDRLWSCECINMAFILWYNMSITYGGMVMAGLVGARKLFNSYAIDAATDPEYWWLRTTAHRDSIFMLSGVILAYDFFGKKNVQIGPISYIKFVLEKYYRFLPKMIAPIMLFEILTMIGDGPNFNSLKSINTCSTNYWKNILFFHNFAEDGSKLCVISSFFLSAFFHLHLISPIFLLPLHYSAKWGLAFNVVALIGTGFVKIVPKLWFGMKLMPFEVSQLDQLSDIKQSFWRFYIFTDQYIYLFIFGILVGFVVRTYPDLLEMLTKNRYRTVPITLVSIGVGAYGILWSENFKYIDKKHNELDIDAWYICAMLFISLLLAWLIILYYKDNGLASSKIFNAFIRLSIGFLVNFNAISFYTTFTTRTETSVTHMNQMKNLAKDAIVTLLVSYVFYVVLESPFIRLLEIIKNKSYPIKLEKECKPENDKTIAGSVGHCDVCNNNYLFTYRSEK